MGKDKNMVLARCCRGCPPLGLFHRGPYSGQQGPEKGENMYQMCKGAGPCNTTVHGRVSEARHTSLTLKALTPYLSLITTFG